MPIGNIIREKRKEKGYIQEQVADYLGVSAPAVNKWEKGTSYPDISLLSPIARLLETDLNTLLCFEEEMTEKEMDTFCNQMMEEIQKRVKVREFINTSYDYCTGSHVGPDTIALFYLGKDRSLL